MLKLDASPNNIGDKMPQGSVPILITFILYSIALFAMAGVVFMRTKNLSDYMLAGRTLSGPITALGAGASDMSSWLLMALPGAVYILEQALAGCRLP
jgi:sodium/proline symporter